MPLENKVLAEGGEDPGTAGRVTFDPTPLLAKLLAFDEVTLLSARLKDIAVLERHFGAPGVIALLKSGALSLYCDPTFIAMIDTKVTCRGSSSSSRIYGPYDFPWAKAGKPEHFRDRILNDFVALLTSTGKHKDRLVEMTIAKWLPHDEQGVVEGSKQFNLDLDHKPDLVLAAINKAAEARAGTSEIPRFTARVHRSPRNAFEVETDLGSAMGWNEADTAKVIGTGLLGVAGVNEHLDQMRRLQAIGGIRPTERALLSAKLGAVIESLIPRDHSSELNRITKVLSLPTIGSSTATAIDLERFVAARQSDDARQFRIWLRGVAGRSDEEILAEFTDARNRIGVAVSGLTGKALRLLVSAGIGAIPPIGTALGVGAGLIDSFVVDKLFPRPSGIAFLADGYPSLFK